MITGGTPVSRKPPNISFFSFCLPQRHVVQFSHTPLICCVVVVSSCMGVYWIHPYGTTATSWSEIEQTWVTVTIRLTFRNPNLSLIFQIQIMQKIPWSQQFLMSPVAKPGKHPPYGNTYREAWFCNLLWPTDPLIQIWRFPKTGVPPNGWFISEHPIKMDDNWGCPYFRKPPNLLSIFLAFLGPEIIKWFTTYDESQITKSAGCRWSHRRRAPWPPKRTRTGASKEVVLGFRCDLREVRDLWSAVSSSKSESDRTWSSLKHSLNDLKQFEEFIEEFLAALISFRPKKQAHVPEVEPFES